MISCDISLQDDETVLGEQLISRSRKSVDADFDFDFDVDVDVAVSILYPSITSSKQVRSRETSINSRIRFFIRNFERQFTPRGWLRLASNLAKTRFRRFPTFHFSTPQVFSKHVFSPKNLDFTNLSFWRSSDFFIRVGRCVVKSYCPNCPYFWGDFLGEGVKVVKRVFWLCFGPKMTLITSSCDVMIVWYYDNMIIEFMEVYGSLWKFPWSVDPRTRTK